MSVISYPTRPIPFTDLDNVETINSYRGADTIVKYIMLYCKMPPRIWCGYKGKVKIQGDAPDVATFIYKVLQKCDDIEKNCLLYILVPVEKYIKNEEFMKNNDPEQVKEFEEMITRFMNAHHGHYFL